MLNAETKRHIDAARDVLVGVAPNPMTQIDQITYALIYKFMDDMDEAAIKAGGERSFFTGDLAPYAWSNLVDTRIGSQEKMDLFAEALTKFAEAPQLPELFRTIFRAAFLPYRSPETLGLFIKEINYFDYSHPEELGNAYEYLLSIMSSQGDAGQFRTPRHIIDFMVDVLDPTKDDTILDPACGTGGFLVSSYNHILEKHDGKDDPNGIEKPLTPAERKKLTQNLAGYDIDPSMVRIAQVNMYLHQFKNPQIFQYDGLTSEERWNDKFDVILANPPFMSPKGGIKPHNKFGIQSNRAEVLFVDYIASHLKPTGRAAIVVPEGIVFQGGKAYKELRKNLVENGLYAVVSLPGGVFQPYSGVKTSILFISKEIAKKHNEILFLNISADGFSLGASKRVVEKNDLPRALEILRAWTKKEIIEDLIANVVNRSEISKTSDYNLSVTRFLVNPDFTSSSWPMAKIGSFAKLHTGGTPSSGNAEYYGGDIKWLVSGDIHKGIITDCAGRITELALQESNAKMLPLNSVMIALNGQGKTRGTVALLRTAATCNQSLVAISPNEEFIKPDYLYHLLKSMYREIRGINGENQRGGLNMPLIRNIEIPLPPLEVQDQIVAELDGYAAIVSGAKQIVGNWKSRIERDQEWDEFSILEISTFTTDGSHNPPKGILSSEYLMLSSKDVQDDAIIIDSPRYLEEDDFRKEHKRTQLQKGDVLLTTVGTIGRCAIFDGIPENVTLQRSVTVIRPDLSKVQPEFLMYSLQSSKERLNVEAKGVAQQGIYLNQIREFKLAIPSLEMQNKIVAEISKEKSYVEAAKKLIETYEAKTQAVIAKLWSE